MQQKGIVLKCMNCGKQLRVLDVIHEEPENYVAFIEPCEDCLEKIYEETYKDVQATREFKEKHRKPD